VDSALDRLHQLLAMLRHERELLQLTGIAFSGIDHPGSGFSAN
jgi:hypothetical protein